MATSLTHNIYHLYTDNQAAEHIATQPNMNDHSRSIDIRIHGIRQDYLDNAMRIGGVASEDNTTGILTKNLQPHLHQKHCKHLNLTPHRQKTKGTTSTNNSLRLTSLSRQEVGARSDDRDVPLTQKCLPRQLTRINIRKSALAHPHKTTSQRVDLTDRTRQRQQAKPLTHKLVKLLKVAHISLPTNVRHDPQTTQKDTSDHKNKTKLLKVAHISLPTNVRHDPQITQKDTNDHKNKTINDDNKQ
jgi:hypothetical protein